MSSEKLKSLRASFKDHQIDGYFVFKANAHQSEYLGPEDERLRWLTQFTGSAGSCLVLQNKAVLFVDGRYILQAPREVDTISLTIINTVEQSVFEWLFQNIPEGCRIGFDPWLLTIRDHEQYQKAICKQNALLIPLDNNLIDDLWQDRPKAAISPIVTHPPQFSGIDTNEKIKKISQKLQDQGADLIFVNSLESVNWLFNIRGQDLPYMPVVYAFALIDQKGHRLLFADLRKIGAEVDSYLGAECILKSYDCLISTVETYARQGLTFLIDPQMIPVKIKTIIEEAGGKIVFAQDPTLLMKACKNDIEIKGMQNAHLRDGAALTQFLAWIADHITSGQVLDEWQAAQKLHEFRVQQPYFRGESFPTISASGPHGAIVHYHALQGRARFLQKNDVYLIDSGGHYDDGSTDVTRTIILGKATSEQKDRFTRVLKGHIALANLIFPQGTNGMQIDVLARQFLWQIGLDYSHGTGHGVGSVLNIHEGPQGISKRASPIPLQVGMILSNEPGYYKENHYGIRIESLLNVVSHSVINAEQPMLKFDTLTMAPIDRNLIETSLLSKEELTWLNQYHACVYKKLMPLVNTDIHPWLLEVTATI